MRATKEMLDACCSAINGMTQGGYYVGYENGACHLFKEEGSGRRTMSYGNTKKELCGKMMLVIEILIQERRREEWR